MSSYSSLCKRAGLPAPTGFAAFEIPKRRGRPKLSEAAKKEFLRDCLEKMVARGEIAKTADGRYLPPVKNPGC